MSFFDEALPYAEEAHARTGVLVSVILAQWADETAYGGPDWSVHHNPGNVGSFDNQPVASFPTLSAGTDAYVQTMNNGLYNAVKHAVGWQAQCVALGRSPWASAHYNAKAYDAGVRGAALLVNAGIDLEQIVASNNLIHYDAPSPAPPPVPNPLEKPMPFLATYQGSYWVVSGDLTTRTKVATPNDGTLLTQAGYKVISLSDSQMAGIPVVA